MASLTQQMQDLQKQQAILAEKIRLEEEQKIKESYTIERLEQLNYNQSESIKKYKSNDSKYRGTFELQQTNLMTNPRFQIILEILKKQDARITELEKANNFDNEVDNIVMKRASTVDFSDLQMMKRY